MPLESYMEKRLACLRKKLLEEKLDALLLIDSESNGWENLFYYSGFRGSSAVVVVTQERSFLATDSRYLTQAAQQSPFEIRAVKTGESQVATAGRLLDELKSAAAATTAPCSVRRPIWRSVRLPSNGAIFRRRWPSSGGIRTPAKSS